MRGEAALEAEAIAAEWGEGQGWCLHHQGEDQECLRRLCGEDRGCRHHPWEEDTEDALLIMAEGV